VSDGLPQASLIISATVVFASLAWSAGMVNTPQTKCSETVEVVQYFPLPEPAPLIQTPPLGWPVLERQRADDVDQTPTATIAAEKDDSAEQQPRRHHRRHRRHWR